MTDIIDRLFKPRPPPETEWEPNVETSPLMRPTHKTPKCSPTLRSPDQEYQRIEGKPCEIVADMITVIVAQP